MKKYLSILTVAIISLGLTSTFAQPGGGSAGPKFDGAMAKLFGDNTAFSAAMEFQTSHNGGNVITMPGKMAYDAGKSRFEMNMSEAKGMRIPPEAVEHMKSMGMDTLISISRPDKNAVYIVYPGLHSLVEMPPTDKSAAAASSDFKIVATELGREKMEGYDCVKNKVIVTDKDGTNHVSTVWNAAGLNNFPVKIVTSENGQEATILFKKVSLMKPEASSFEAPADFTKYDNIQTMMQTEMMKKMTGGLGKPPGQ
jgi:hypothetical protein